jgi:predicted AAA+ superfamily ATPase
MAKKYGPTWQPKPQDYKRIFEEQNPWHRTGEVPNEWAKQVERPLAKLMPQRLRANEPRRFQLILGPRRIGKTTSMYQTIRDLLAGGIPPRQVWSLRLDHPLLMQIPLGTLVQIVLDTIDNETGNRVLGLERPLYLFLDELTYSRDWALWLKTFYDETWPVRVVGSSSSSAALRGPSYESGVGRWEEQYLAPYLFSEYLDLVKKPVSIPVKETLFDTISACIKAKINVDALSNFRRRFLLTGGFPELLMSGQPDAADDASLLLQSQRILRNDAVERAIYKDIPQAFGVDNPMILERMLYTLAGQVTGILSPNTICQSIGGLSQPTFVRYLNYLERAFLVFTLPNYSGSEASIQKRGRKLYFVDAAVRNAALQRGLAPLSDTEEMGLLIENMAAGHLQALSEQSQVRVYYWRDKNDEIDLVYDHPEFPIAFEMGSSGSHHRKGIHAFEARFKRFNGRCFLVAPNSFATLPSDNWDGIGTLPLDLFLLAVGAQAEYELAKRMVPDTPVSEVTNFGEPNQ